MTTLEAERPQAPQDDDEAEPGDLRSYADVDPLPAEWLWDGRIPFGELTIMAGLGGTGKGMLCADLAARISRGDALPGGEASPAGSVLLVSAEDDPNVVTVNRLRAAGADMRRVFDLSYVAGAPFEVPACLPELRQAISGIPGCQLVILDPLAGIAPVSLTAVQKVRAILAPLRRIAADTGVAIVITHHLTKGREVAGSRAVVDGVRSVLTVNRDPADETIRVVDVLKSNMGADDAAPVRYIITGEGQDAAVEYVTAAGKVAATGQEKILAVLETATAPVSGQEVAARTAIPYSTARVLLSRLIAAGKAHSPARGWFSPVAVSDADQKVSAGQAAGQDIAGAGSVTNGETSAVVA